MRFYRFREPHGFRLFIGRVKIEFYWWPLHVFGFKFDSDSEDWTTMFRLACLTLFVSIDRAKFATVDARCFEFYMDDWRIRFVPWGRAWDWRSADPWWIRGVSVDVLDLVLGRAKYRTEELASGILCRVPMPEGSYAAVAKIERQTWKRPRWFASVRTSAWLEIPKGIPHAGKGENSWDCGDDGLFGIGGDSVEDAIRRAQESVTRDRHRYGTASDEAVREALREIYP